MLPKNTIINTILEGMRQVVKIKTNNQGANYYKEACTGGALLKIIHCEIPEVRALAMPGSGEMATEFMKIFEGITYEEAKFAAGRIITNNDNSNFDAAFAVLGRLMDKYPNLLVKKFDPSYYERKSVDALDNTSLELEILQMTDALKKGNNL
jgi:hypothetical protein